MAYAEVADVRAFLKIVDGQDDALLAAALEAAEAGINNYCHDNFSADTTATARYYDVSVDPYIVRVDSIANTTDFALATDDTVTGSYSTAWVAADYQLLPLSRSYRERAFDTIRSTGNKSFPLQSSVRVGLVRVTARWGWPSVPVPVKQACVHLAARIFKRGGSPEGVAGFGEFGVVRIIRDDPEISGPLGSYIRQDGFA